MPTLTRKLYLLFFGLVFTLFIGNKANSQNFQTLIQIDNLLNDAVNYSDRFITPATDGAVYQSSSNWIATPKKKKLWDVTIGIHNNLFFVPKSDRKFTITNADFTFFQIENAESAIVPTAMGNDNQIYLSGTIDDGQTQNPIRLKTPEGIDQETIYYPYLQGSVGLWNGTEFIVKYSGKVKLKKSDYYVYGFGLKHNLSQYFKKIEEKKYYVSTFLGYSKEDISFHFLDVQTDYGNLGLNQITGIANTWQLQINASKELGNFEFMTAFIGNTSNFTYHVDGPKGEVEAYIPVQSIFNRKLENIYKTKINIIGELAARYKINKFFIQTSLAFGKFVNSNLSLQYEFK